MNRTHYFNNQTHVTYALLTGGIILALVIFEHYFSNLFSPIAFSWSKLSGGLIGIYVAFKLYQDKKILGINLSDSIFPSMLIFQISFFSINYFFGDITINFQASFDFYLGIFAHVIFEQYILLALLLAGLLSKLSLLKSLLISSFI